jgi:hypothetical protein
MVTDVSENLLHFQYRRMNRMWRKVVGVCGGEGLYESGRDVKKRRTGEEIYWIRIK